MHGLSSSLFQRLGILCVAVLLWMAWGPVDAQAQHSTCHASSFGCCSCIVDHDLGCILWDLSFFGWERCDCHLFNECVCRTYCTLFGSEIDLEQVKRGYAELLPEGKQLSTTPEEHFLASLNGATSETGETMEQVYFGEGFGLVLFQEDLAVVYPLEEPNVLTIRTCTGEVIAQAYRAERAGSP